MLLAFLLIAHAADLAEITALQEHRTQRVARHAPTIPDSAYERALAGRTATGVAFVEGIAAGKGWAVAVVDAPVAAVWKAANDPVALVDAGEVSLSVVTDGATTGAPRTQLERMSLPVFSDRWWMVNVSFNADLHQATGGQIWELAWTDATDVDAVPSAYRTAIEGAVPVGFTEGAVFLASLSDGRTLVEYFVWTDPGGAIPARAASRFAAGSLADLMATYARTAARHATTETPGFVDPTGAAI